MNIRQQEIQDKCIAFAVKIDALRKVLNKKHREYNKADQIDRSASAIGALYSEAVFAESEADYIHKLGIAQKEANETIYWLKVIHRCEYIEDDVFQEMMYDVEEIMRIITAIIVSLKRKNT